MMNRLIVVGASGHGRVISDIAMLNGYTDIAFLDDDENIKKCAGFPVIGKTYEVSELDGDKIIAIGNSEIRERMMGNIDPVILIHPDAVIGSDVKIEKGTVIMAGAVINQGARIGKGCIINTCSSIDHDCTIDDFVHVAVASHLCGAVHVGKNTWIGAGSTINNNVDICSDCMIGSGAVVIRDITVPGTYVGVPADRLESC